MKSYCRNNAKITTLDCNYTVQLILFVYYSNLGSSSAPNLNYLGQSDSRKPVTWRGASVFEDCTIHSVPRLHSLCISSYARWRVWRQYPSPTRGRRWTSCFSSGSPSPPRRRCCERSSLRCAAGLRSMKAAPTMSLFQHHLR